MPQPLYGQKLAGIEERADLRRTGAAAATLNRFAPGFHGNTDPSMQLARDRAIGAARQQTIVGSQIRRGYIQDAEQAAQARENNARAWAGLALQAFTSGQRLDFDQQGLNLQRDQLRKQQDEYGLEQEQEAAVYERDVQTADTARGFREQELGISKQNADANLARANRPQAGRAPRPLKGLDSLERLRTLGADMSLIEEKDDEGRIQLTDMGQRIAVVANGLIDEGVPREEALIQAGETISPKLFPNSLPRQRKGPTPTGALDRMGAQTAKEAVIASAHEGGLAPAAEVAPPATPEAAPVDYEGIARRQRIAQHVDSREKRRREHERKTGRPLGVKASRTRTDGFKPLTKESMGKSPVPGAYKGMDEASQRHHEVAQQIKQGEYFPSDKRDRMTQQLAQNEYFASKFQNAPVSEAEQARQEVSRIFQNMAVGQTRQVGDKFYRRTAGDNWEIVPAPVATPKKKKPAGPIQTGLRNNYESMTAGAHVDTENPWFFGYPKRKKP